jgi:hypothetical protein
VFLPAFSHFCRGFQTGINRGSAVRLLFSQDFPKMPIFNRAGYNIGLQSLTPSRASAHSLLVRCVNSGPQISISASRLQTLALPLLAEGGCPRGYWSKKHFLESFAA